MPEPCLVIRLSVPLRRLHVLVLGRDISRFYSERFSVNQVKCRFGNGGAADQVHVLSRIGKNPDYSECVP